MSDRLKIFKIVLKIVVYVFAALGVVFIGLVTVAVLFLSGPMSLAGPEDAYWEPQAPHFGIPDGGFPSVPRWTPDDGHLVFNRGRDIYVVDAASSQLQLIAGGNDDTPAYSPDVSSVGDRLAYIAYEHSADWWFPWNKDHDWEIVSSAIDGSDHRRLTERLGNDTNPVWSPDGTRIAYLSVHDGRTRTLQVMKADGSDIRSLAPSVLAHRRSPAWSPDGRNIAFTGFEWEKNECGGDSVITVALLVVGADGGEPRKIGDILQDTTPAWSPDGRLVAFSRLSKGDCRLAELHVVSAYDQGSSTILRYPYSNLLRNISGPLGGTSWSPDGSEILMGTFIVKADGSAIRRTATPVGFTSWSRDGSRIAVHVADYGSISSMGSGFVDMPVLYTMASDGSDTRILVKQDWDRSLSPAEGKPLNFDTRFFGYYGLCYELAEPGLLRPCE